MILVWNWTEATKIDKLTNSLKKTIATIDIIDIMF